MSLKGLNWRKGLFRMWLFFSVLWVVGMGALGLYPATSRYIETVKAAHELKSLRESISYEFIQEPDKKIDPAEGKSYKVQESQTGVTVAFDWYQTRPPSKTADLDDIFRLSLGQQEIVWDKPPHDSRPLPEDFEFQWAVPPRQEKLSDNESAFLSKLQRIEELQKTLESRKNGKQDFLFSLGMTLFPPAAVLILGMGVMWVFSGFVSKQSESPDRP